MPPCTNPVACLTDKAPILPLNVPPLFNRGDDGAMGLPGYFLESVSNNANPFSETNVPPSISMLTCPAYEPFLVMLIAAPVASLPPSWAVTGSQYSP